MKFKSTLMALGVLVLVGAYAYFYEFKGGEKREKAKSAAARLVQVDRDSITKLQVSFDPKSKHKNYSLEKKDNHWVFLQPVPYGADLSKVSTSLGTLTTQEAESTVGENVTQFADFGLEPAQVVVTITDAAGVERKVEFGSDVPTSYAVYARLSGSPKVVTLSKSVRSGFDRDFNELRDQSLVSVERGKIQEIKVSGSGVSSFHLARDKESWRVKSPINLPADLSPFNAWLTDVMNLRSEEFAYDGKVGTEQLAKFNLNQPSAKILFIGEAGKPLTEILFGRVKSSNKPGDKDAGIYNLYAHVKGSQHIGKLGKGVWDKVSKDYTKLVLKKPVAFATGDVAEVILTDRGKSIALNKDKVQNTWSVQAGTGGSHLADQKKVEDLLRLLASLEVAGDSWNSIKKIEVEKSVELKGFKEGKESQILARLAFSKLQGAFRWVNFFGYDAVAAKLPQATVEKIKFAATDYKVEEKKTEPASKTPGEWKMLEPTVKDKSEIKKLDKSFVDAGKKYKAKFETSKGSFEVEFFAKEAPYTVSNFLHLARNKFYDGLKFHRVIDGFMAQGGDPKGDGTGGPGYKFQDEFSDKKHERGSLSMANAGPATNGSQFFICFGPQAHLNGRHSVFGTVMGDGMKVVDQLKNGDAISKISVYEM